MEKQIDYYQNVMWVNKFSKDILVENIFHIRKMNISLDLLIILNEQTLQEVEEMIEKMHISNNISKSFYNYLSPIKNDKISFNSCGVDILIITCDTYGKTN